MALLRVSLEAAAKVLAVDGALARLAGAAGAVCLLLAIGGCTRPPESAYVAASASAGPMDPAGKDARGEDCTAQRGAALPADLPVARSREVYCGGWTQPAARVVQLRGPADAARLDALAAGGLWRTWLDQRVTCAAPQPTTLAGGVPARLLACTRKNGGWPHVALVAAGPEGPVLADGVATATPVMEGLATGRAAAAGQGQGQGQARSAALEIAVRRLSAEAFSANDVGRYEELMNLGRELNQAENFAAAEDAYRAALALQERVLGQDNPDTATALVHLALNLSNQGRMQEASVLFTRATVLSARAADPVARARLAHYQALSLLQDGQDVAGLARLREAEALYAALVPSSMLRGADGGGMVSDPAAVSAMLGLSEVRRYLARTLARGEGRAAAPALIADSRRLLRQTGLENGLLVARSLRTEAGTYSSLGRDDAATRQLEAASQRFAIAAPGERPEAVTLFLNGARRGAAGRRDEALTAFRAGAAILRARQIALPINLVLPYLDALDAEAAAHPADGPALRKEAFAAAQLAQRSNTVRFVQQASARIGAAAGDARVAEAVRRLQDADQALRGLFAERDSGAAPGLDARIAAAQQARAEAESVVAAAAPGYRQLLLSSVDADAVAAVLGPQEALVTMLLGRSHGWVLMVRGGAVQMARSALTEAEAGRLVNALRAGVVDAGGRPGRFDPAPAQALYAALLAPLARPLEGAETLVVVPDGPLLGIPFGMLLTGPADPAALGAAPWLVRRHAVVHVPSPQTLVTLRGAGPGSAAPLAYGGFGDFVPPSPAQLIRSFPVDRCAADARLAAGLMRLPGTRIEVQEAERLMGARPQDVRLGPDFTAASLRAAELGQRRIIHLATHALLPGELSCLQEPSIVVSPQAGAADANSAFVKASDLLGLKLDADLIILSACNTGGPGGAGGGEALSGLARAFFYAGARGLMVTHWAVDDAAAALTVADSLRRQQAGASSAAALRGAQLLLLDEAGQRLPDAFGHPFYWAPFALIGDGRRAAPVQTAAAQSAPRL
ncbi:CHAT domain-containing protein [Belnapia rosea]|uniref:CHAT domain-containing protein n=1 Tax=Belnapia rosea TaxID=938405 RepID=A0A1G6WY46_9PROT|nr:CHAT domain-containing protein [Belnapia rosea]SDD70117.1 CHAT domain-containing protein [Belnapia rosea]